MRPISQRRSSHRRIRYRRRRAVSIRSLISASASAKVTAYRCNVFDGGHLRNHAFMQHGIVDTSNQYPSCRHMNASVVACVGPLASVERGLVPSLAIALARR